MGLVHDRDVISLRVGQRYLSFGLRVKKDFFVAAHTTLGNSFRTRARFDATIQLIHVGPTGVMEMAGIISCLFPSSSTTSLGTKFDAARRRRHGNVLSEQRGHQVDSRIVSITGRKFHQVVVNGGRFDSASFQHHTGLQAVPPGFQREPSTRLRTASSDKVDVAINLLHLFFLLIFQLFVQ